MRFSPGNRLKKIFVVSSVLTLVPMLIACGEKNKAGATQMAPASSDIPSPAENATGPMQSRFDPIAPSVSARRQKKGLPPGAKPQFVPPGHPHPGMEL